jgi:4-hydroxybenzoate polyprenyltransferase
VRSPQPPHLTAIVRALRPHQWIKNLLVFVPIVAAHSILRADVLFLSFMTFFVFCLSASGVYVLNDISDIQADREHPRKRVRPFAAGDLTIASGLLLATVLLIVGVGVAAIAISSRVALLVVVYVTVTSAYSLRLKQRPVTDVFTLTGLYILRIVVGGVATDTPLSSWLLAFALFLFLSLAFIKRFTELLKAGGLSVGRGYQRDDVGWMQAVGTSAGYMAVLVLALYVNASETSVLYSKARVLWLLCPLLLMWLTRLWFRAGRGMLHDDPVTDALADYANYAAAAAAFAIILLAL